MSFKRFNGVMAAGALIAAAAIPATFIATDASLAATFDYDGAMPSPLDDTILDFSDDAGVTDAAETTPTPADAATAELDAETECMAKVVVHEAGNQPRAGQLAVAQLIVNRIESGRFADSVCGVVNQPGQFFKTASYNPRRDTATWARAVEVAREAQAGHTAAVVPGAMFFRASYAQPTGFFRTRTRVAAVGSHVFYR